MPYPKQPAPNRKRGVGISLDPRTLREIDALAGGSGKRSEFIVEHVIVGLEARFGAEWREIANARIVTDTDLKAA